MPAAFCPAPLSLALPPHRSTSRRCALLCAQAPPPPPPPPPGRLRRATPADAAALSRLVLSCGMNPRLGDMAHFLVFDDAGGAGVVGGGQVRPGAPGELASLAVRAGWRGRGVGGAIARALVRREGERRDLCLLCLTRGVAFYERLGFRRCGDGALPARMRVERAVGRVVAAVVAPGNDCVGMARPAGALDGA